MQWAFRLDKTTKINAKVSAIKMFTLFLQVTWMWYFESGHRDNCASCVSVNKFPIIPPPNTSHVIKHWCWSGSFAYQTTSAIVREPSRTIDCTDNSIISDVLTAGCDEPLPLTSFDNCCWCTTGADDDRGAQLFQHCMCLCHEMNRQER